MRRLTFHLVALLLLAPCGGCHYTKNVTGRARHAVDLRRDVVYLLAKDAFLFERPAMNFLDELRLDVPRYDIRPKETSGKADDAKLIGPVPAGTTFRFKRVVEQGVTIFWSLELVVVRFVDGPHKGKEVELSVGDEWVSVAPPDDS